MPIALYTVAYLGRARGVHAPPKITCANSRLPPRNHGHVVKNNLKSPYFVNLRPSTDPQAPTLASRPISSPILRPLSQLRTSQ